MERIVEFSDRSGLEIRLVYYPPYHSKYHPIERCWSSLQKKRNGFLLTCWQVIRVCASRMTWKGQHPSIVLVKGNYPTGVVRQTREIRKKPAPRLFRERRSHAITNVCSIQPSACGSKIERFAAFVGSLTAATPSDYSIYVRHPSPSLRAYAK